jgi:aminopeptidase N
MKFFERWFVPGLCVLAAVQLGFSQSLFEDHSNGEARDRQYHVVHYKIQVSFDEAKKEVFGTVTTTLVPFLPSLRTVKFDAEDMTIKHVMMNKKELHFTVEPKKLAIELDKPYSFNDTLTITTEYSCIPKKGLYFIQPDSAYPNKPHQIWSQGEDMDNHFWFPCYDFPNDKATTEMIATVRDNYTVLSNGKLLNLTEDKKHKTKTFHWEESKPISSYLIMIAAGEYSILEDHAGKLPVEYYVYKGQEKDGRVCFAETPKMIQFFEDKIGFPFAWEKYAQVEIADFMYGGMENASATTLIDNRTVYDARARVDYSTPTSLIAHELAHQWWGDVVTCKDWRHIWLNESFASYFDPLYHEYTRGEDEFALEMYHAQESGINSDNFVGRKPIVSPGTYVANIYPRGAAVLNMLRFVLGDTLFWRALHHYIVKNQFTPVETNDLKLAIEEATGQNLYWFFDEWVYKAGYPDFHVSYTWSDSAKAIFLKVKQEQKMDSLTGVFRMPVDIEVTTPKGTTTTREKILTADTTYVIPCAEKPTLVIFDKGNWILKELHFEKSLDELKYQAEFATNPIDRIRALDDLSMEPDTAGVVQLVCKSADSDPFYGVRLEAVDDLSHFSVTNEETKSMMKAALLAACKDNNQKVRSAAVTHLGGFKGDDVLAELHHAMETDSSYGVIASAIRSYAEADSAHAVEVLTPFLSTISYLDVVANAAFEALAPFDSSQAVQLALERVRYGAAPRGRFAALNILSRYGKNNPAVLKALTALLDDKTPFIRRAAIRTLGNLGDASVLPALEKMASYKEDNTLEEAAQTSIQKIKHRMEKTETGHSN